MDQANNQEYFSETLDLLDVGVGYFDEALNLKYANRLFRELRGYPDDLFDGDVNLRTLLEFNAARGDFGPCDVAVEVDRRIEEIRSMDDRQVEQETADNRVLSIHYRKTGSGGWLISYAERTEERRAQDETTRALKDQHRLEARLLSSIGALSEGVMMVDANRCVELWNEQYMKIFGDAAGIDIDYIVRKGRPFFEMIREGYEAGMFKPHPGGVDAWMAARVAAWDNPASKLELELANGSWILLNEKGLPDGGRISVYTDITEQKRREAEIAHARGRFEEAIEAIKSGFVLWDANDHLVIANTRYKTYFADLADKVVPGTLFSDIIAAGIDRGFFPLAIDDPEGYLADIKRRRSQANGEAREQFIGGYWLQITDHRTRDGGIVSIYTDVTELKEKQAEIEAQAEVLELTLESMGQGISLVDENLNVTAFNQKFLKLMDFPPGQFKRGFPMEQAFRFNATRGEYGPGDVEAQVASRLETASKFEGHRFQREKADGTVLEIVGIPVDGGGFVSTYTDVTERAKADAALKAALAEFDAVIESIDYGVLFMGPDLRARIVNRAFRDMWGIPQDFLDDHPTMREVIEFNRHTGLYSVAAEEWDDWIDGRIEEIRSGEFQSRDFERADGRILSYRGVVLPDGGRMMTYFDITELKRAEKLAREGEARISGILANSPIGVGVIDDNDEILFHNPRFALMLGAAEDHSFVGETTSQFWVEINQRAQAIEAFERDGVLRDLPVQYRGVDGRVIWAQSTYERAHWRGKGARLVWIYDITEEKKNREAVVAARDAAEAALADLRQAQERLVQSEKMASLGQLTAGIAHEIKNPLNFVNNFAKLSAGLLEELEEIIEAPIKSLEEEDREDAEYLFQTVRENLGKIDEHGRRADSIVKNMLLHSRDGPSERQTVALNPLIEEAMNLAYHGARAENSSFNVEMTTELDPDLGDVECHPQDLMRVFLNLMTNGMYAADKRRQDDEAHEPLISLTTRDRGDAVEVEVRDNGAGIPPEVKEKIFLPFFTTKPAGEGTGLGLSLSYDIVVKQHSGSFDVESEPGAFTVFKVTLPRSLSEPEG